MLQTSEITGLWRKLHIEQLDNWYSSLDVIVMIKSRKMRQAGRIGHIISMGEMRNA
jgi:hypothetical protein